MSIFPKLWKLSPFKDLVVASNFPVIFVTSNFFNWQKLITFEPDQLGKITFAVLCSDWLMQLDALVLAIVAVIGGFLESFKSAISLRSHFFQFCSVATTSIIFIKALTFMLFCWVPGRLEITVFWRLCPYWKLVIHVTKVGSSHQGRSSSASQMGLWGT